MKVLILANIDIGLYKFRKELLEELVKNHEVYVSIPPQGKFVNDIKKIGVKIIPCNFLDRHGMNPVQEIRLINYYRRLVKKLKPGIVLTYTIKPNVYGGMVCAGLGVSYVANITGLGLAVENGGITQKITLLLYRYGLRKAQKVFFQNEENKDFMLNRGIVKTPYDVLPGSGVNLEQYKVISYPDGDTVDFVFVARVMKEKGVDEYLKAARIIRKKYPETRFHICGFCEQNYEQTMKAMVDDGIIIFHGLVSDMNSIYEMASCTIHPTFYPEGLSNVLLESSACGRPIITTDRSGCREVVEEGVNGFVVRQQDSKDLVDKIEKFLKLDLEERKKMGLAGRRKVEKEFDRNIVIKKYLNEVGRADGLQKII